jgi:hypothetical protein
VKSPTEQTLVNACLQLLRLRGFLCWRQNQGAARFRSETGRSRFVRFSTMPGVSDVLAVLPPSGRLLAVEVKVGKNRTTPDQEAFLAALQAAGGVAVVIRDIQLLLDLLDRLQDAKDGAISKP